MIILILSVLLGALFNAIRGGQHETLVRIPLERKAGIEHFEFKAVKPLKWYQYPVNWLLSGDFLNSLGFGLFIGITTHWSIGLVSALGMFLGAALGWGAYITAMAYDKIIRKQVEFIDWSAKDFENTPDRWGFITLTRRGLIWGAALGLPIFALSKFTDTGFQIDPVFPVIAGGLMGAIYLPFMKLIDDPQKGWELAEWAYGAVLWPSVLISITFNF
ncbi:MAG: hypothetical protein AAFO69_04925 [Bacteroidota bacterium]